MFQVRVEDIREMTTNGPTYMQGRQYYRQGRVRHLDFDREKGVLRAQVEGSRIYNVRVILNANGELHDASCTCSAFAAYWGFCRHIAAALLAAIDAYGKGKTRIIPSSRVKVTKSNQPPSADGSGDQTRAQAKTGAGERTDSDALTGLANGMTDPLENQSADRKSEDLPADLASIPNVTIGRHNRNRSRDFVNRLEQAVQQDNLDGKQILGLAVCLHAARGGSSLPWLGFTLTDGTNQYPIVNVEQFSEALARGLVLELAKDFAYNPGQHRFADEDQPIVDLLVEAFENDYKAVFGTSHAASRSHCLTLNATRLAAFLRFAGQLTHSCWRLGKETTDRPILLDEGRMPLMLQLSQISQTPESQGFLLQLISSSPPVQMTASRNVYLVGDTFYLPSMREIRLLDPILPAFHGGRSLLLTRDEAVRLMSRVAPTLESVCPVRLHPDLEARTVRQPLEASVEFEDTNAGLRADVLFRYDTFSFTPWGERAEDANEPFVLRDLAAEQEVLDQLADAGFTRQGNSCLLADPDALYAFLEQPLRRLRQIATVVAVPDERALTILPAPRIKIQAGFDHSGGDLVIRQDLDQLQTAELPIYLQALRDRRAYYRTRDGSFRKVRLPDRDVLIRWYDLLASWQTDPAALELRLPRFRALSLDALRDGADESITIAPEISQMIHRLKNPTSLRVDVPISIAKVLRPYQKTGVAWLQLLDSYGLGGILADDMGLGKTLQAIAFIALIRKKKRPSLVISPTSLTYNWLNEFRRFAPELPVLVLEGNRHQRSELIQALDQQACVITSYSLLRRDIETLSDIRFAACFLDEAQNIKNPETLSRKSVKQLQADTFFALTGTPVENNLMDLWSIFDAIMPGYLHSQAVFAERYEQPRDNREANLEELGQLVRPFIMRRLKKDVLRELPAKIETQIICDMTEEQRAIYDRFLERNRPDLEQELRVNGFAKSQIYILALLTRLRQICCHPGLFIDHYRGGSGKLMALDELLDECFDAGHRALVFSQFTSMLDLIRNLRQTRGDKPFLINGQVPAEERIDQVQRFNAGEGRLFLISLRAGGTGLNLTGADTVIHFDPWWNPAVEDQATDRAYRIGQENVVQVIKLCARNSVEEKILELQKRKQALIDAVITPEQNLLSKMTPEEVLSLFER